MKRVFIGLLFISMNVYSMHARKGLKALPKAGQLRSMYAGPLGQYMTPSERQRERKLAQIPSMCFGGSSTLFLGLTSYLALKDPHTWHSVWQFGIDAWMLSIMGRTASGLSESRATLARLEEIEKHQR